MNKPIVIGIAGGSASGKTSIAISIMEDIKKNLSDIVMLEQDSYYKLSNDNFEQRIKENYDHPNIIDFDLLIKQLKDLVAGKTIEKPVYSFEEYNRKSNTVTIKPAKIIIVEGILIFYNKELRNLFDVKVYVDTDDDIRLLRRMERDIKERGRNFESVKSQYLTTVKPMHLQFVEPTKRYADVIIPNGKENIVGMKLVSSRIKYLLGKNNEKNS